METFIGILVIIMGTLVQFPGFTKTFIKFGNTLDGTKTNITSVTMIWYRIGGVVAIIAGIGILTGFIP